MPPDVRGRPGGREPDAGRKRRLRHRRRARDRGGHLPRARGTGRGGGGRLPAEPRARRSAGGGVPPRGRAAPAGADPTDPAAARAALARATSELGPVDLLVHCAWPGWSGRPFERTSWTDFERDLDAMLRPAMELTQAALPAMRARGSGRIVLLGSTSLYELNPEHTAYAAAKGALLALTRTLARELGRDAITVNMVSPSLVWTGDGPEPEEFGAAHRARSALGRLPTAEEVAAAIVFLASPLAAAITGVQLPVARGSPMQVG
jgi:3-oxoacyl-[acyl-carrier protein] reductase